MQKHLFIDLCRSRAFESACYSMCGQSGTFALITTANPGSTQSRLNNGWLYVYGPRRGTRSPPLAYYDDWDIVATWSVDPNTDLKALLVGAVSAASDRPCLIGDIERRLMKDDNNCFPGLRANGMSQNGLDNVFCLPRGYGPVLNPLHYNNDGEYQDLTTQVVVHLAESIIDALKIEVLDN